MCLEGKDIIIATHKVQRVRFVDMAVTVTLACIGRARQIENFFRIKEIMDESINYKRNRWIIRSAKKVVSK